MVRLLIQLTILSSFLFCQIGFLDTKSGIWVKYFTTKPGAKGYPNTNVFTVHGKILVYEKFDWSLLDVRLTNQKGHCWYRISPTNSYWVYGMSNFIFQEKK